MVLTVCTQNFIHFSSDTANRRDCKIEYNWDNMLYLAHLVRTVWTSAGKVFCTSFNRWLGQKLLVCWVVILKNGRCWGSSVGEILMLGVDGLQVTVMVFKAYHAAVQVGNRGGCASLTCKLKMYYCLFFSPLCIRQREQTNLLYFFFLLNSASQNLIDLIKSCLYILTTKGELFFC